MLSENLCRVLTEFPISSSIYAVHVMTSIELVLIKLAYETLCYDLFIFHIRHLVSMTTVPPRETAMPIPWKNLVRSCLLFGGLVQWCWGCISSYWWSLCYIL